MENRCLRLYIIVFNTMFIIFESEPDMLPILKTATVPGMQFQMPDFTCEKGSFASRSLPPPTYESLEKKSSVSKCSSFPFLSLYKFRTVIEFVFIETMDSDSDGLSRFKFAVCKKYSLEEIVIEFNDIKTFSFHFEYCS